MAAFRKKGAPSAGLLMSGKRPMEDDPEEIRDPSTCQADILVRPPKPAVSYPLLTAPGVNMTKNMKVEYAIIRKEGARIRGC